MFKSLSGYQSVLLFAFFTIVFFVALSMLRIYLFKFLNKYSNNKEFEKYNLFKTNVINFANRFSQIGAFILSILLAIAISGIENDFLSNFAGKSLIIFICLTITYLCGIIAEVILKRQFKRFSDISLITGFVKVTIYIIGIMVVLQSIGVKITPLITALGIGGIAFAFAIQPTLANFFSGLNILASGQVSKGDYIVVSEQVEGFVKDVAWRNTSILSLSNILHIVPNQVLSDAVVSNYSKPDSMFYVRLNIGVAYSSNLSIVEKVCLNVATKILNELNSEDSSKENHEPVFRYTGFGDSSIDFMVILPIKDPTKRSLTIHNFIKELHLSFNENGIEIPFPIRTIVNK